MRDILKNRSILTFATLSGLLLPASGFAQSTEDWLPQSGVKSPYASLSLPTALKSVLDSLAGMATELQRFRSPLHARARPLYSGSYPAAVKKLAHSSGVKASRTDPAASHKVVTVLAALARKRALSLANAISIGLKSGL